MKEFGRRINNRPLADIVVFLYRAALTESTRKTYSVGQRHWARFQLLHPEIAFFPFNYIIPNPTTLSLCFFAGYLASRPSIRRYTTVRGYICHVKALWRDAGCPEDHLNSRLLRRIMRGIRRALPAPPDAREAFIPFSLSMPDYYLRPPSSRWLLFKAAVVLGSHAMLRFGAFCQFSPKALTLVLKCGRERAFTSLNLANPTLGPKRLLGILFTFTPKYTLANGLGTAFFCHICDVSPSNASHCPVCVLSRLVTGGLLRAPSRPLFDPLIFSPGALTSYLGHLAGKPGIPPNNPYKPHSLRIGGHTFYTVHGMDPDLRDHLARRAITRCSLRYFRAAPASNLHALRAFYKRLPAATLTRPTPSPQHLNRPHAHRACTR